MILSKKVNMHKDMEQKSAYFMRLNTNKNCKKGQHLSNFQKINLHVIITTAARNKFSTEFLALGWNFLRMLGSKICIGT